VLAKAGRGHFHELVDLDGLATAVGSERQTKCRCAFAFAVAGVDDDKAAAFAFGLFIGLFGG